ncbi:response regulator, partial [Staphylococcus aureus]
GYSGIEILKQIKTHAPNTPVLMLSMYPPEQYAVRAIKAGASGYLTKESAPYELVTAVQQILRGRKYITNRVAEVLAGSLEND